jgi:hypothetical protein
VVRIGFTGARVAAWLLVCSAVATAAVELDSLFSLSVLETPAEKVWRLALQAVPFLLHATAQVLCAATPLAYAGQQARNSAWLTGLAALFFLGQLLPGLSLVAGLFGASVLLLSFAVWLQYLEHLGLRLGDAAVVRAARAFRAQFFMNLIVGVFLFGVSVGAIVREGPGALSVITLGVLAVLGLRLVLSYGALVRSAARAVERYAPARVKS